MSKIEIDDLDNVQLAEHIRKLDKKARNAQSELAYARRTMKKRKKKENSETYIGIKR